MPNAVFRHARNQWSAGRGGGRRVPAARLLVALLTLMVAWSGLAWVTAAPAAATPTGTGGQYVPVPQLTLVDTWWNLG